MTNKEKYNKIFMEIFSLTEEKLAGLTYNSIPEWDSVGHMALMAEIEEVFDIMMDTDDIIGFSSYEMGLSILKNYGIEV